MAPLLERLHHSGTAGDKAGNRQLFFDQYAALLLLYFFNPILTSFNGLQQASALDKVQKVTGGPRVSKGSLSEAQGVFDATLLEGLIADLAERVAPVTPPQEWAALKDLVAVDGSLLPACSRLAWALWLDDGPPRRQDARPLRGAAWHPGESDRDCGRGLRNRPTAADADGRTLVCRGPRLRRVPIVSGHHATPSSSFIGRIRDNAVWELVEERPVSAAAHAAGVRSDRVVWLGCAKSGLVFKQPVRVLEVDTGKTDSQGRPEVLLLATDRLELEAELVALGYRFRWAVELFFRWFKCILGRRHLLAESQNGVTIQVYVAIIASLLLSLWVGKKPTKRTYEMFCLYFSGWATEEELAAHLQSLKDQDANSS